LDEKVTLAQAAKDSGVHVNTVKNWRKAGRLNTAEKIIERGIEVWYVDPTEVEELALQSKAKSVNNTEKESSQQKETIDYPNTRTDNLPAVIPQVEQFMVLVERSQQPLLERIDNLVSRNEELTLEVGTLRERLKNLEEKQVAQAQAQQINEVDNRVDNTTPAVVQPMQQEPVPDEKRKGFWARLFSGE
jgi:hypothetical protein